MVGRKKKYQRKLRVVTDSSGSQALGSFSAKTAAASKVKEKHDLFPKLANYDVGYKHAEKCVM